MRHASRAPASVAATVLLAALLAPALARAQELPPPPASPRADRALAITLGLGVVVAEQKGSREVKGSGRGFYGTGEYVLFPSGWFSPRAYAGVLIAPGLRDCGQGVTPCDVSATVGFAGGKVRLTAPLPYVAPFVEAGLGGSAGHFSTRTGTTWNEHTTGLALHVPLAFGAFIGEHREVDLGFQFLLHPGLHQAGGALALGMRFPL